MGGRVAAQLALVAGRASSSPSRRIAAPIGTSPWPSALRACSSASSIAGVRSCPSSIDAGVCPPTTSAATRCSWDAWPGAGVRRALRNPMRRLLRTLPPLALVAALSVAASPARAAQGISPARGVRPAPAAGQVRGPGTGAGADAAGRRRRARTARRAAAQPAGRLRRSPTTSPRLGEPTRQPSTRTTPGCWKPPPNPPPAPATGPSSSGTSSRRAAPTSSLPISPGGIDAVGAWRNLIEAGRPGAAGIVVAVLDTGIAYRYFGTRFRRSPDFASQAVRQGLRLRRQRPLAARRKRPRHPCRRDDRREDQQRGRRSPASPTARS